MSPVYAQSVFISSTICLIYGLGLALFSRRRKLEYTQELGGLNWMTAFDVVKLARRFFFSRGELGNLGSKPSLSALDVMPAAAWMNDQSKGVRADFVGRVKKLVSAKCGEMIAAPVSARSAHIPETALRWRVCSPKPGVPDWFLAIWPRRGEFNSDAKKSAVNLSFYAGFGGTPLGPEELERVYEADQDFEVFHLGKELAMRRNYEISPEFNGRELSEALESWTKQTSAIASLIAPAKYEELRRLRSETPRLPHIETAPRRDELMTASAESVPGIVL